MGGVCSVGAMRKIDESDDMFEHEMNASSGFSGKLRSIGSLGRRNKKIDTYPAYPPNMEHFENRPNHIHNSGELGFSISRELKPLTPARSGANKRSGLNKPYN